MTGRRRFEGDRLPGAAPLPRDAVPGSVVDRAKEAFRRREPGILAALVFDSAADEAARLGGRILRFEHSGGWVEILVTPPASGDCAIQGRASPAPQRVELEPEGRDVALVRDAVAGVFEFPAVPRGLVRLRLFEASAPLPVHTDWVRL